MAWIWWSIKKLLQLHQNGKKKKHNKNAATYSVLKLWSSSNMLWLRTCSSFLSVLSSHPTCKGVLSVQKLRPLKQRTQNLLTYSWGLTSTETSYGWLGMGGSEGWVPMSYHLLATLSPPEWLSIKAGSCVRHLNVSLIVWAVTRRCP